MWLKQDPIPEEEAIMVGIQALSGPGYKAVGLPLKDIPNIESKYRSGSMCQEVGWNKYWTVVLNAIPHSLYNYSS